MSTWIVADRARSWSEQCRVAFQNLIGAMPGSQPKMVGRFTVPKGRAFGRGDLNRQPVLAAGRDLGNVEQPLYAPVKSQEYRGVIVCRDFHLLHAPWWSARRHWNR